MDEDISFKVNWKYVIIAALLIVILLIGIGIDRITNQDAKLAKGYKSIFKTCADYCSFVNQTGYVRYEPSDTHFKCFCYSDKTKKMGIQM